MNKRKWLALCALTILALLFTGCGSAPPAPAKTQSGYLTIQDDAGRTVNLAKKPERIVPLSISYVDLLYAVGGSAAGRPGYQTGALTQEKQALPEVGHFANINTEQLMALKPDLVIGYHGMHEKLIPLMHSSNIPMIIVKMRTYEDVLAKIKLFGDIAGTQEQAQKLANGMQERIAAVTGKLPAAMKKAAILHVTPGNVTVQLDSSIAGNIANMLRIKNIVSGAKPMVEAIDAVPYSIEKIVEGDPDIILITYMGSRPDIEKRLKSEVESNPAWSGLRAVRNKQVFFLPMELFLLNPSIRYDEAVLYMAKLVYPEIYGSIQ